MLSDMAQRKCSSTVGGAIPGLLRILRGVQSRFWLSSSNSDLAENRGRIRIHAERIALSSASNAFSTATAKFDFDPDFLWPPRNADFRDRCQNKRYPILALLIQLGSCRNSGRIRIHGERIAPSAASNAFSAAAAKFDSDAGFLWSPRNGDF
jgi:hypothetical protein